ncbi:cytochrome CYP [Sarotherodon galilaeus]
MCHNLSKYTPIFLFLALSGIIFLLRNIHTVENWNCQAISSFYQLQSRIHSSLSVSAFYHNHTYCTHVGQKPSPEDELEERYLLELISWPSPPPHSGPTTLKQTSDPVHSLFAILPTKEGREWHVGDQLEVLVQMHDFQGPAVVGQVVDHKNGFYSALFPLLWVGSAQVEVMLVHSSEAVAVLRRLREERPDRVFFKSMFRLGLLSETTVCNLCLPPDHQPLCNYTDLHTGEPWYCYKPKVLSCDTRINHAKGGYLKNLITNKEALLFKRFSETSSIDYFLPILHTLCVKMGNTLEENSTTKPEHIQLETSGYYYMDSWRPLDGFTMRQFNESSAVVQCLKNKVINMYGDSTVRQWFEYLIGFVPELKEFNLYNPKKVGPLMAVDSTHNILLKYRCHGPPIRFTTVMSSELRYISNELDGLSGGPNVVVVLSIWSHFSTFPVDIYIRRLRHIRQALVRLIDRAPGTLIVIRSANLQALDQEVSLYNSDWYSQQLDQVLRTMFKGLNVLVVDAWQMTLAHHLPHALHPPPPIVKQMIDMLLSYVCPERKKSQK